MGIDLGIEVHVAGDKMMTFKLPEAEVRRRAEAGASGGAAYAALHWSDWSEDDRLRGAAYHLTRRMLDPLEASADYPLRRTMTISDDDGVWVIPISSIIAVRLIEAGAKQKGSFGFIPPTE